MWFVIWELAIPLAIALLLGLALGWLMWRWRHWRVTSAEWTTLNSQLDSNQSRIRELESWLGERESEVLALRSEAAEFNPNDSAMALAEAAERAEELLAATQSELELVRNEAAEEAERASILEEDAVAFARQVEDVEVSLAAAEKRLVQLEAEVLSEKGRGADLEAKVAAANERLLASQSKASSAVERAELMQAETEELSRRISEHEDRLNAKDHEIQNLKELVSARSADDLKRIKGIGPKLEVILHRLGITTFAQLGELDNAGVQDLQSQLSQFPGRVERENWVSQAKALSGSHDPPGIGWPCS